jgi:hypothetical protein
MVGSIIRHGERGFLPRSAAAVARAMVASGTLGSVRGARFVIG